MHKLALFYYTIKRVQIHTQLCITLTYLRKLMDYMSSNMQKQYFSFKLKCMH